MRYAIPGALLAATLLVFMAIRQLKIVAAPLLVISTHRLDLGDGKPKQTMTGAIELANSGSAPLEFSVQRSCGCTSVSPTMGILTPHTRIDLQISIQLPEYANAEKAVQVIVNSNDPLHSREVCFVLAKAPAPFIVNPKLVDFGRLPKAALAETSATISLERPVGENRKFRMRLAGDAFTVATDDESVAHISSIAGLPVGDHYDTLEVVLEGVEADIVRIPVHLQLVPPLAAVPSTLYLRKNKAGSYGAVEWIAIREKTPQRSTSWN